MYLISLLDADVVGSVVIGLFIATRCDAITDDTLDYLEELNKRTYLSIEVGLQTIHEKTSKLINRGHTLKEFDTMVKKLRDRNIEVVLMDEVISSKQVEQMGISRQLLKYHVQLGHVRTVPYGKQKRYLLEDIKKLAK